MEQSRTRPSTRQDPPRDLEISHEMPFHEQMWRLQRIGWALMGALMLIALLGFLGPGVFARTTAGERGAPLQVEYERFARAANSYLMRVRLAPEAARGG